MKKKLKDITIGEFVSVCHESKCIKCPFKNLEKCHWIIEAMYNNEDLEKEYEIH